MNIVLVDDLLHVSSINSMSLQRIRFNLKVFICHVIRRGSRASLSKEGVARSDIKKPNALNNELYRK